MAYIGKADSVDAIGTPERIKSGTMGRDWCEKIVHPASRLPGVVTHEELHSKHLPPRLELID